MASCYYPWFDIKEMIFFFFKSFFSLLSKDINSDPSKLCVYFIDIGQREYIPINNIRPLPDEFQRKPAFAIACCLYNVCPLNGNEQLIWKSNDQVHDEFNRLMANNVTCRVRAKQDQLCYDVEIDIPSELFLI
jgi:hypothetical protein